MTPTFKAITPAGEWVEGWLLQTIDPHYVNDRVFNTFIHSGVNISRPTEVLPETVCMATGRPDSTRKMMFNGDFVQVDEWMDAMQNYSGIYRIEYNNVDCAFLLVDDRDMITRAIRFNEMDTYTLTGKNIHDKTAGK